MSKSKDTLPSLPTFNSKMKNIEGQTMMERVATAKQKAKINLEETSSPPSRHTSKKLNPLSPIEKEERKDLGERKKSIMKSDQDTQLPRQKTARTPGITTLSEFMSMKKESEERKQLESSNGLLDSDAVYDEKEENGISKKGTPRKKSLTEQKLNHRSVTVKARFNGQFQAGSELLVGGRVRSKSDLTGMDKTKYLQSELKKKDTVVAKLSKEMSPEDYSNSEMESQDANDSPRNDPQVSPIKSKSSLGSHLNVNQGAMRKNSRFGTDNQGLSTPEHETKRVNSRKFAVDVVKKSKEKIAGHHNKGREDIEPAYVENEKRGTEDGTAPTEEINERAKERKKFDRSFSMKTVQISVPQGVDNSIQSQDSLNTTEMNNVATRRRNFSRSSSLKASFLDSSQLVKIMEPPSESNLTSIVETRSFETLKDPSDPKQENNLKAPKLNRMLSQNLQSLLNTNANKLESKLLSHANDLQKSVADFRKLVKNPTKDILKQMEYEIEAISVEESNITINLVSRLAEQDEIPEIKAPITKKKIGKNIRKTWVFIYRTFQLAQKILKSYKQKNYLKVTEVPVKDARTLSYLLKVQIIEGNPVYISQVEGLLKDEPFQRNKDDVTALEKMLSYRMEDFRKYPLNERIFFCQSMRIEKYKRDTLLMMEDHVATCFYFLLSGQVEIFKLEGEFKYRLNLKNPGSVIGELRVNLPGSKRTACAATTTETILLWISKEEYIEFVNRGENNAMRENMLHSLKYMQLFDKYEDVLEKISSFFKIYTLGKNTVIQEEGKQTLDLSWIIEGNCKINRSVSFLTKTVNGKQVFSPFVPEQAKKDNYTTLDLSTQILSVGEWFPSLPIISDNPAELKYLGPTALKKDDYVDLYSKMRSEDKRLYSKYSVVADSTVIIASMPYSDFLQLVPREVIFEMVVKPCVTIYPIQELQDQYLQQQMWSIHKKTVVNEIVK
ncbi:Cyclic nucleotide-binding domain-containing protein 2 [Boothiomyces sp. JEL0866]|nr:Cyclic nucleotide-binding domain-containing protein 2 [Boothiomyces sp. JEL0866]